MASTQHAETRMQQRGVSQLAVDLLLQFGAMESCGDGATKFFLDKAARKKLATYAGSLSGLLLDQLDIYAVVGDGNKLITVGHRLKRISHR